MRTILLFISSLLLCPFFYSKVFAHPYLEVNGCLDKAEDVELSGELLSPKTKSFIIQPIKVTKYLYELNVDFLLNLENIKIQIYDSMGSLVYSNIVDTQTLNQLIIDISYLDNGNYTIRFTNSQDQYLRGHFLIIK